jgi:hypothetical protein
MSDWFRAEFPLLGGTLFIGPTGADPRGGTRTRVERRARRRRLLRQLREQRRGQPADLRADWRLLGVTTDA